MNFLMYYVIVLVTCGYWAQFNLNMTAWPLDLRAIT